MKLPHWVVIVLASVVLSGFVATNLTRGQASAAPQGHPPRYQVSAYAGSGTDGHLNHGCYILDTETGELWHARHGGRIEKLLGRLR